MSGPAGPSTVLLLGNRRQSLTVARELAATGVRIMAGRNRGDLRDAHAHRSRAVNNVWSHDHWRDDPGAFTVQLHELLERDHTITTVFPIDESAIAFFDTIRSDLPPRISLALANSEALRTCLDKEAMLALAETVGVASHASAVIDGDAVEETSNRLGLPVIVKPMDDETIRFGVKAEILRTSADVKMLSNDRRLTDRRVMVQRFATGPRHNVYFAAHHGEIVGAAEVRIGRTDRVDGTGLAVFGSTVAPTPELLADTTALVEALAYHGVGCAQFVRDPDSGTTTFLELNPRLGANFAVVVRAGLPLARLALELSSEAKPRPVGTEHYRRGLRFAWTFGALAGLRFERREGVITTGETARWILRSLREALTAPVHITWSWRDPLPTLLEFARPLTHAPTATPTSTHPGGA